jgi:hypothetical protein
VVDALGPTYMCPHTDLLCVLILIYVFSYYCVLLYMCAATGLLQWRVLADNLGTSGSFEWKVPDSCPQGTYYIQAKIKGAVVARCAGVLADADVC